MKLSFIGLSDCNVPRSDCVASRGSPCAFKVGSGYTASAGKQRASKLSPGAQIVWPGECMKANRKLWIAGCALAAAGILSCVATAQQPGGVQPQATPPAPALR